MGGRGSGSGGGGGLTNVQINQVATKIITQQQASAQPAPTQQKATVDEGMFSKFMKSTDDQKAAMIDKLRKEDVPAFLADNDFQKLTYAIGGNNKPKLVSDLELDKIKGKEIYRTVNSVKDTKNGITYSADMIASQIQKGSVTRVSDSGGSVYGRGIYFAGQYNNSTTYGKTKGSISQTAVVRAKIDTSTKSIQYTPLYHQMQAEIKAKTKLGKAIAKCDQSSRISIYGLSKGYSVIESGHGYYNVLDRKCLTMSSSVKASSTKWK